MADWSEEGEAPRVTFTILAIDGDARDAAEMKRFTAELTTPADGEYGTSRGVERLPGWAGALGLLLLPLLWLSGLAAPALGGAAVLAFDVALVIAVVAALLVPRIAAARERARRGRLDERRRFEMVVAGDTVTLTAPGAAERSFPLRDIARFDAGPRVSIVRNDGSAVRLPFVLASIADRDALARRLGEVVAAVRASAGGYRGPRVDVGHDRSEDAAADATDAAEAADAAEATGDTARRGGVS